MDEIVDFQFKKIVGGRGCYAIIFLKVNWVDQGEGVNVQFDYDVAEFKSAIMFGVDYFYSYYRRSGHKGKLNVVVYKFSHMLVDTNHITTAYVTVQALAKALGITIPGLSVDESTGSFVFPIA